MWFAPEVSRHLEPAEQDALSAAVEQVGDLLIAELVTLYDEPSRATVNCAFSTQFLPTRFADSYDFAMMRRLHVCLIVVAGRLQHGWEPLGCRGEELVLRAILDQAETSFEERGGESTDGFAVLVDLLFEDLDHEFLFDPALDGIDDPETAAGMFMGVRSLSPSAWFDPLSTDSTVHPLLS